MPTDMVTCPQCGLEHSDQLLRCPGCDERTAAGRRIDRVYGELDRRRRLAKQVKRLVIAGIVGAGVWYVWSMAEDMTDQRWGAAPPPVDETDSEPQPGSGDS